MLQLKGLRAKFKGSEENDKIHKHNERFRKGELKMGTEFFAKTLMFNGYGDEVANLYTGMDLKKYF